MKSLKEKLEHAGKEYRKPWQSMLGTKEKFEKSSKRKYAAKMKAGGYLGRFINEKEQETR